ncbi:MAG TPA: ABC transporter permease, partial [Thermoanaerobaculia bacterium]|nr:ABC transporter permease [Thermoanaerobaculia bacterium]
MVKKTGHSLLAIAGLALGTTCLLFALLYVREELSYDRFHEKADRIYRISQDLTPPSGEVVNTVFTQIIMAPTLIKDFPEMAEVARIMPWFEGAVPGKVAVRRQEKGQEKQSYEWFAWADGSLPRIFDLPLIEGDPAKVLVAPNSVVLSEPIARKIFGDEPAVGKVLKIDSGYSDENYRVTGVMRELPSNSHFHFHVLASFSSLDHVTDPRLIRDNWWANDVYTYFLLAEGASAEQIEKKLPAFVEKYYPKVPGASAAMRLQRLRDIHLHSDQFGEIEPGGDPRNVKIAAAVALFVLLITALTFLVLTAPRPSFKRALTLAAAGAA